MGRLQRVSLPWRLLALLGLAFAAAGGVALLLLDRRGLASWPLAFAWLAVGAVFAAATALILRRLLRPLHDLARIATALAEDGTPDELPVAAAGEFGQLADALAAMREQLECLDLALRESESRYRLFFDTMADGLLLLDQDGVIVAANPRLAETHGWTAQQLNGRPVSCLLRDEDHALAQALRTPPADRPAFIAGRTFDREGRERETEIRAVRLLLQGRPHALVILRDVTAVRRLERQLLLSQKYESVGHLAAGIAHDFNNLLTPVLGYSEMLLASPELGEDARADLLAIQRAGDRARSLARRLLAYSRRQGPAMQELDLGRTIAACEPLLRQTLREDIELRLSLPDEVHLVQADPAQIEQVLMNLAVNAMDAMPDGGRLEISLSRQEPAAVEAPDDAAATTYSRLRMRDTGPGIEPSILDRVCEPLFTTKDPDVGTGMGLTTAQGIVKQHGGWLTLRNHERGGCEVEILLPAMPSLLTQAETPDTVAALPRGGGQTVVLVEDDEMVRQLIAVLLAKYGYEVRAYANGSACLADLAARPGAADLLLTDVVMPGMNGPQLRDRLHAAGFAMPTLFISGYAGDTLMRRGLTAGQAGDVPAAFLQKPLTPEALLGKLRQMLEARSDRHAG